MSFSEREGFRPKQVIQIESMNESLRNSLWNAIDDFYWNNPHVSKIEREDFFYFFWTEFFKMPKDELRKEAGKAISSYVFTNTRHYYSTVVSNKNFCIMAVCRCRA